jgi:branched-chain amino acid transport system ATP-binding protein
MNDAPLLSVEGLAAGYGETQVLRDVSLSVEEGEVVALVGRNGVGKTTTLRCIAGNIVPTGGRIRFRGEDVTGRGAVETAQSGITLVPEDRRVFDGLTVEENLRLARLGADDGERDVESVMETFERLAERRDNLGAALSGGERQMVAIARALVAGSDLLLLDEPTEGLAPTIVEQVQDIVAGLHDEDHTILLVEQNVEVALDLADRVYVLDQGSIVYEGTAEELREEEAVLDRHLGVSTT